MSITKVEMKEDGVLINYHLSQPLGYRDINDSIFVAYDSILSLPECGDDRFADKIEIPLMNRTIALVFDTVPENNWGPPEETMAGFFLLKK